MGLRGFFRGVVEEVKEVARDRVVVPETVKQTEEIIQEAKTMGNDGLRILSLQRDVIDEDIKLGEDPLLYYARAAVNNALKRYPEAQKDLENVTLDEENLKRASKMGLDLRNRYHAVANTTEFFLGNYDKAVEHFMKRATGQEELDENFTTDVLNHYVKGVMFEIADMKEEARDEYQKVLEISPNLDSDSLTRFRNSSEEKRVSTMYLNEPEVFFYSLAEIEERTGDFGNALKHYQRVLELEPENELFVIESEKAIEYLKKQLD